MVRLFPSREMVILTTQAQTPQQRRANDKYARQESTKRGKPEAVAKRKEKSSSPISPVWIGECFTDVLM